MYHTHKCNLKTSSLPGVMMGPCKPNPGRQEDPQFEPILGSLVTQCDPVSKMKEGLQGSVPRTGEEKFSTRIMRRDQRNNQKSGALSALSHGQGHICPVCTESQSPSS